MGIELTERDFELIENLINTPGVSGRESRVADVIEAALPKTGWVINRDPVGNLTSRKGGKGKSVLLISHMDEVGLIVRRITPDGFLKVERLGGISVHTLPGSAIDLWTNNGRLDALVGAEPAHLINGNASSFSIENVFVDVGASSKAEVLEMGVNVGDVMTWKSEPAVLNGDRIRGKALDDRLGCFALVKLAELLGSLKVDTDITLGFVVQEESMVFESAPIVNQINPDFVIGVDGTLPFDTPDVREPQNETYLGMGPCIKLMDAIRGKSAYLPDWELSQMIMRFMDEQKLPYQREIVIGLSTALSLVPFMNQGIKTAAVSLPIRYHHSAVELADLQDLTQLITLLKVMLVENVLG